ncbi:MULTISPECIES: bifunctional cystathionine gamma-lyase/homocysteine desulfhydrase [Bacillales]|jgi:cystathionine gamma-lyase / homocysteine desulfhydrase|uniref:Bifunctional cystathionine gamma-lyase/homocysteine desulfhydrase n=1 Tax=Brevibacillus aydinogluensis TaxID=927786 RepID=A0AA48RGQ9_9BACL|nr:MULTISPECIES: bifunctional cystathionine gamma-lyase/homocysteine desulfhydrase [Bacillales]REK65249.1 MAG: bifunctional cystathionine gamma-lyase/homocysteine desulfhydrase [Brevibacillus sp.]MDT3415888.1 cystathionine gamma-lyase/homocysteine desulfhydrase [Brevibacillus aydinogluensis]NNV03969.1 bifunctional cystathionine gamma-lyase/homocysteine desulfhydrase [Brevibacillus sp. MCWH]UFJ61658.1 bifunctional cystathionine gamma-lyase/homocysteine desulfhydrase [Anoxybacillus sediminis]CAJ
MRIKTRLIHGGIEGDPHTGAVSVPIYQVSTYKQEAVGKHKGYEYSRTGNPTRHALETYIAELEGGARGLAFGSGMAALSTVLSLFSKGDHLVVGDDVYGGTYRVITRVFSRLGLDATYVDTSNTAAVEAAIRPETKAIIMETPTNPLLKVSDIAALSAIAKANNILLLVDNTFMTPYWQNPLELGADIVYHSATKYLGGHSDVVAGLVVAKDAKVGEELHFLQNAIGGILGPQDSWLLLRGMKTLGVRMEEHEQNARTLANWLAERNDIKRVIYPGLPSHPNHELAKKQARGFGGMISFDVGSAERADEVLAKVKYFTLAESLGAVESLISVPARMTHASIPAERRAQLGITDGLIRISVGIEDVQDLIDDLEQALS